MKKQKIKIQSIYGDFVVTANCPKCRFGVWVLKVPDGVEVWCSHCSTKLAERKNKPTEKKQNDD